MVNTRIWIPIQIGLALKPTFGAFYQIAFPKQQVGVAIQESFEFLLECCEIGRAHALFLFNRKEKWS